MTLNQTASGKPGAVQTVTKDTSQGVTESNHFFPEAGGLALYFQWLQLQSRLSSWLGFMRDRSHYLCSPPLPFRRHQSQRVHIRILRDYL